MKKDSNCNVEKDNVQKSETNNLGNDKPEKENVQNEGQHNEQSIENINNPIGYKENNDVDKSETNNLPIDKHEVNNNLKEAQHNMESKEDKDNRKKSETQTNGDINDKPEGKNDSKILKQIVLIKSMQ